MSEKTIEELAEIGENALAHYGVKGMKWGVRRDRTSGSTSKPRISAENKARAKTVAKVAVKSAAITGAAVAAGMVAGPIGSMTVSALAKAVDAGVSSRTVTTETITIN